MIEMRPMSSAEIAARDGAVCASLARQGLRRDRAFPAVSPEAECMAAHMIEIAGPDGACTDADLISRGWLPGEVERHGAAARQLALGRIGGRA